MQTFMRTCWQTPYVLLILATMFWGGNAVVGRLLVDSLPPVTISALRSILAMLVFCPFILPSMVREWSLARQHFKLLLVLVVSGVIGFNLLTYWALNYTTAINVTLLNSATPLFMIILSYVAFREKMTSRIFVSIMLSIIGIVWVTTQGSLERLLALQFNSGDLIMLVAVFSWSVYSIILKQKGNVMSPLPLFGYCLVLGVIFSIPAAFVELQFKTIHSFGYKEIFALLYLGFFPSVCSFLLWNRSLVLVGPSKASIYQNLIPVFAAIFAYFMLGERLTLAHIVGGLLVFVGVFLAARS